MFATSLLLLESGWLLGLVPASRALFRRHCGIAAGTDVILLNVGLSLLFIEGNLTV